jgi:hypothetical protein
MYAFNMVKVNIIHSFGHSWVVGSKETLVKEIPFKMIQVTYYPCIYVFTRIHPISPLSYLSPKHREVNGLKG